MAVVLEKCELHPITRELCERFRDMTPAPGDRPIGARRLAVHQESMETGIWRPTSWASAFCKETGIVYRVNGKHTSTLLCDDLHRNSLDKQYRIMVEHYVCDTTTDVAELFATFDAPVSSRTAINITDAFAATLPELSGAHGVVVRLCAPAIAMYKCSGDDSEAHRHFTPAQRAHCLVDHVQFVLWLDSIYSSCGTVDFCPVKRVPVVAAMFATYSVSEHAARVFWTSVITRAGASALSPPRVLAEFLRETNVTRGGIKTKKKASPPREFYCKCITSWNAWRKGITELKSLKYHASSPAPVAI